MVKKPCCVQSRRLRIAFEFEEADCLSKPVAL